MVDQDVLLITIASLVALVVCFFTAMSGSGSGLILVPVFTWCGLTPVQAIAVHKFEVTLWTTVSAIRYARSGKVLRQDLAYYIIFGCIGTFFGAKFIHYISSDMLRTGIGCAILAVTCTILLIRNKPHRTSLTPRKRLVIALSMLGFGIYEGLFGSGNGYFIAALFFALTTVDELELVGMVTVTAAFWNFVAVLTHYTFGSLNFGYAIPVGISAATGAWFGAKFAIAKGKKFVRWIIIIGALISGAALLYL